MVLTESGRVPSDWSSEICGALRDLTVDDTPSLEVLLLDEVGSWVLSPENQRRDYDEQHGGLIIANLFKAIQCSRDFRPAQLPIPSDEMATARKALVAGAHEFAEAEHGLTKLIARLMPAMIAELEKNAPNPGPQLHGVYFYSLLAISSGVNSKMSKSVARGISESFTAWDSLMAAGFRLPWHD